MFRWINFIFLFCSLGAAEIDNKLKRIPLKEREKIEQLFAYFVKHEGLGHVLFKETKPACMISLPLTHKKYQLPCKVDHPFRFQKDLGIGWQVWTYSRISTKLQRLTAPKFPGLNDRKQPNIRNMGLFAIVQSRGFRVGQTLQFCADSTILSPSFQASNNSDLRGI